MEIINRINKRIRKELFSRFFYDSGNYNDSIFIAGSGRSGTTWLADTIAQVYSFRLIFEPFWHLHKEINGVEDFFHHRYIKSNNNAFDNEIREVLKGEYRNYKTNFNFNFGPYKGRVIKDICANLFLTRIKKLSDNLPIVYVIRSPYDVVNSRYEKKKWGRPWGNHAHIFLQQKKLVNEVGYRTDPKNEIQDHAISYCFENYLPLKNYLQNRNSFLLIKYEDLFSSTEDVLIEIIRYIDGLLSIERDDYKLNYKNKYLMTSKKSKIKIQNTDRRKLSLNNNEISDIDNILKDFGIMGIFRELNLGYEE